MNISTELQTRSRKKTRSASLSSVQKETSRISLTREAFDISREQIVEGFSVWVEAGIATTVIYFLCWTGERKLSEGITRAMHA